MSSHAFLHASALLDSIASRGTTGSPYHWESCGVKSTPAMLLSAYFGI